MSIKIGNNEINDVKLGNTQVNSIYLGSTKVWEKAVDPTVNFYDLTNSEICTFSGSSGAINAKGLYLPAWDSKTSLKVHWMLSGTNIDYYYKKYNFPYRKGSSSTSTLSKIGLGSMRANSSNEVSSGSVVYGLTLQNETDLSNNITDVEGQGVKCWGSFTVTPGSSSTYPKKCIGLIQVESLYPLNGGSLITPYQVNTTKTGNIGMVINGVWTSIPLYKMIRCYMLMDTTTYTIYEFYMCVEDG